MNPARSSLLARLLTRPLRAWGLAACPALAGLCRPDGRLAPQYLLSLDGERFLTDPNERLRPGDRLVLLSADAGG